MYTFVFLALILTGTVLCASGGVRRRRSRIVLGVVLLVGTPAFFCLLSFWGEMLWFDALGQGARFWTAVKARILFAVMGMLLGAGLLYALTWTIPREARNARTWPVVIGGCIGLFGGLATWERGLQWWYGVTTGTVDPILGKDVGFYLFTLPFLDNLYWLLLGLVLIAMLAGLTALLIPQAALTRADWKERLTTIEGSSRPLTVALGAFVLLLAWGSWLNRFHLLYSTYGVVTGPGWTDVHVRLPAYWVQIVVLVLVGVILLVPGLFPRFSRNLPWRRGDARERRALSFGVLGGAVILTWFIALQLIPGLVQWLIVSPNEITKERPYVAHNIRFTRAGFRLDRIEEREYPVIEELDRKALSNNQQILDQVRIWDPRALKDVYKQFQEFRLYYEFPDVDIDRYVIDGHYQQVMISPREMELSNLPAQSQTFVNRRFTYTHGFGLTLAPVNKITSEGLPTLLIKDLPPKVASSSLKVSQPRIYYGELTTSHVVANSTEQELDYPEGKNNRYNHYSGSGGVQLSNWWRSLVYGWKFDGTRFLFSDYITSQSRILFHRQVRERVKTLAPFLEFDADPYVVLHEGRIYWIIDAYTTSSYYPYSEAYFSGQPISDAKGDSKQAQRTGVPDYLHGANYVRNSVKAVVDAYNGTVDLYVLDAEDPILQVWRNVYPGLFRDRNEMPAGLQAHVRYPEGLLLAQGLVYAKYHMNDPAVFYNQEDLWVRATEKYYDKVQPVEPYYVTWQSPQSSKAEFILMLPFTPKNRQVLNGWIAGMCDPPNYGRLIAYRFPKKKRVLGTQQVETKIDQDRYLSEKLTLWDQRGSRVIRGNVLVIPLAKTLLYVEPIYLQAEAAAYPELRLVAVMHNDTLSYAETFEKALEGLFKEGGPTPPEVVVQPGEGNLSELAHQANQTFEEYLSLYQKGQFEQAGKKLERVRTLLQQMTQAKVKKPPEPEK